MLNFYFFPINHSITYHLPLIYATFSQYYYLLPLFRSLIIASRFIVDLFLIIILRFILIILLFTTKMVMNYHQIKNFFNYSNYLLLILFLLFNF